MTHHAPTLRNSVIETEKDEMLEMNGTNLEDIMDETIAVWAFGHTHYSSD